MSSRSLLFAEPRPASGSPAWLAKGFRPFFVAAALLAVLAIPLWLLALLGGVSIGAYFGAPMFWHAHEMVFGFAVAVIAGFLLTAVSNWTGRPTASGSALLGLVLLWAAGRVALLVAASLPSWVPAAIDLAFVPALVLALARPIVAANNRRNFVFLGMLVLLELANAATHLGAHGVVPSGLRLGNLVAIDVITLMMVVIGGRVIPMFTRNATRVESIRNIAVLDRAAMLGVFAVTISDIAGLPLWCGALFAGISAIIVVARTRYWGIRHALREPLLWVLHIGHAWIGIGLALRALSFWIQPLASTGALHALTAGAIGMLTLGMMTRVGLGHTGRSLAVPPRVAVAFGAVAFAALARVVGPLFGPSMYAPALLVAGALWTSAFAIYIWTYAPALCTPRVDGRPG